MKNHEGAVQYWNWNFGIGIENPEINFLQLLLQHLLVYQSFPNLALTEEVIIFHVTDSSCNRFVFKFLGHWPPVVWSQKTMGRIPCSP